VSFDESDFIGLVNAYVHYVFRCQRSAPLFIIIDDTITKMPALCASFCKDGIMSKVCKLDIINYP
jgi:hypothetical protein